MVCFQDATGDAAQIRTARGKHYVIFDLPADKGLELNNKQPFLGWVTDINGHPALPFSIAARLILPVYVDRANPGVKLFAEYPAAQLFARIWSAMVGSMDLSADNIFREVERAAEAAKDQDVFNATNGVWLTVEGTIEGDAFCRWLPEITRGDAFAAGLRAPGLAGAEIIYHVGPYMLMTEILGERCCRPAKLSNKRRRVGPRSYQQEYLIRGLFLEDDGDEGEADEEEVAEPNTYWVTEADLLQTIGKDDVKRTR